MRYLTIGGALIINANGEMVFLPVAGQRNRDNGALELNDHSYCWSSTFCSVYNSYDVHLEGEVGNDGTHKIYTNIVMQKNK